MSSSEARLVLSTAQLTGQGVVVGSAFWGVTLAEPGDLWTYGLGILAGLVLWDGFTALALGDLNQKEFQALRRVFTVWTKMDIVALLVLGLGFLCHYRGMVTQDVLEVGTACILGVVLLLDYVFINRTFYWKGIV